MLRRFEHVARCALLAYQGDWVLRVIVGGDVVLAERCRRGAGAFRVAERWKDQMMQQGWHQVLPGSVAEATPESRAHDAS